MDNDSQKKDITREDVLELADVQGTKLGYLLAVSTLDEQTQRSILDIIGKCSLEEIDAIIDFFEQGILMAQNVELNEWLKNQLEAIQKDFDEKQEAIDKKAVDGIDKLDATIK